MRDVLWRAVARRQVSQLGVSLVVYVEHVPRGGGMRVKTMLRNLGILCLD